MARILLVDDDYEFLMMARAILEHAGHQVTSAISAIEALDFASRSSFDLVLTDANMKPHSGYDLIRSLKQIDGFELIPIAMLTGRREKRDVERAVSVGARDYIVKPIDPETFIAKVAELAAKSKSAHRTARFAEIKVNEEAITEIALNIIALSETGCVLQSDDDLPEGTQFRIRTVLFDQIGVSSVFGRVSGSVPAAQPGQYEVRVTFQALDDRSQTKIRQYVNARAVKTAGKAS